MFAAVTVRESLRDKVHVEDSLTCKCSAPAWQEQITPCKVFCSHFIRDVSIVERICLTCGYKAELDGGECFILRKAWFFSQQLGGFEIGFHWPLLYDAVEELVTGTHWHTTWMRQLGKYERVGVPEADLRALMQSLYRHFREAVMDFVDLQHLPFDEVLRCTCSERHQSLVADGITVSCLRSCLRFCAPWLPSPAAPGRTARAAATRVRLSRAVCAGE